MGESEDLELEVGAIEAIYPEAIEKLTDNVYKIKVPQHEHIIFQMSFPENYPDAKPFILDVVSENEGYDEKYLMELFQEVLDSIYIEGNVIIFDLFTELDAILYTGEEDQEALDYKDHWSTEDTNLNNINNHLSKTSISNLSESEDTVNKEEEQEEEEQDYTKYSYDVDSEKKKMNAAKSTNVGKQSRVGAKDPLEGWIISDPITDRKSTFVAFAKEVHSVDEAYECLSKLMEDKKCGRANHAMRAWRVKDLKTSAQYQDCDDDGETAAGSRMLHLMSVMDAWNVMVVCCRWFGGVHIGPDRFKHINSATRDALVKGGFVVVDKNKKSKKKK